LKEERTRAYELFFINPDDPEAESSDRSMAASPVGRLATDSRPIARRKALVRTTRACYTFAIFENL
jgi:hypothetical protein